MLGEASCLRPSQQLRSHPLGPWDGTSSQPSQCICASVKGQPDTRVRTLLCKHLGLALPALPLHTANLMLVTSLQATHLSGERCAATRTCQQPGSLQLPVGWCQPCVLHRTCTAMLTEASSSKGAPALAFATSCTTECMWGESEQSKESTATARVCAAAVSQGWPQPGPNHMCMSETRPFHSIATCS